MVSKRASARFAPERIAVSGIPILGAFSSAISLAHNSDCWVNVETQFGNLIVSRMHTLADVIDNYDALRDAAAG